MFNNNSSTSLVPVVPTPSPNLTFVQAHVISFILKAKADYMEGICSTKISGIITKNGNTLREMFSHAKNCDVLIDSLYSFFNNEHLSEHGLPTNYDWYQFLAVLYATGFFTSFLSLTSSNARIKDSDYLQKFLDSIDA